MLLWDEYKAATPRASRTLDCEDGAFQRLTQSAFSPGCPVDLQLRETTRHGPGVLTHGPRARGGTRDVARHSGPQASLARWRACGCHPPLGRRVHCWSCRSGHGSPLPGAAGDRARACIPSPPGSGRGRPGPTVFTGFLSQGDPQSSCLPSVLGWPGTQLKAAAYRGWMGFQLPGLRPRVTGPAVADLA